MTDNEIIETLKCLFGCVDCRKCPYSSRYEFPLCQRQVAKDTFDLINRQQAEIIRLQSMNQPKPDRTSGYQPVDKSTPPISTPTTGSKAVEPRFRMRNRITTISYGDLRNYIQEEKSKAIKEFAEKMKNKIKTECNPYGKPTFDYDTSISIMHYIDNLVKEIVNDKE